MPVLERFALHVEGVENASPLLAVEAGIFDDDVTF